MEFVEVVSVKEVWNEDMRMLKFSGNSLVEVLQGLEMVGQTNHFISDKDLYFLEDLFGGIGISIKNKEVKGVKIQHESNSRKVLYHYVRGMEILLSTNSLVIPKEHFEKVKLMVLKTLSHYDMPYDFNGEKITLREGEV